MASIYVFNATPIPMSLTLNSVPISGTLSAIQSSTGYAASTVSVLRNPGGSSGTNQFGSQNTLTVVFNPQATNPGPVQIFSIPVDPNTYPIVYDLQLYIFYGQAALISPSGSPAESSAGVGGTPTMIEGEEATGSDAQNAIASVRGGGDSGDSGDSGGSGGSGGYGSGSDTK